ncbi:trypsin-like peptidase domain-containing protein [Nostoc sp. ChiQUE01b]|uniref:trypsin-like peptidase domain-containing protein n=1 Tax=Nostoc sp. ChiQUE01b TaxID=3075376 RepID=UPI002AD4E733|nr:trypsin-like peptidase domain-containing protein [Nostoc sp. ChiQUE01b]MDZ8259553.1 trypsin-like peptidase domain-containing protein [Nostoc sp. ChiQUE01b]
MQSTELEELLTNIQKLQSIMIAVATNSQEYRIQDKEEEYIELYQEITSQIEDIQYQGFSIQNPNNFHSLWDWYKHCKSKLSKSALRGCYIHNLYQNVCNQIDIALCKDYIKATSQEVLYNELEPTQIEEFKVKIEQLQEIMIEVATESNTISSIQYNDENYRKLYQEVWFKIEIFRETGISVSNTNQFRSLWQWYSFYSEQLENTKAARREYIYNLYVNVAKPIEKVLRQYRSNSTYSIQEFIQVLKDRFNQTTYTQATIDSTSTTPVLSNNVQTSNLKLDERFQQQTLEPVADSFSVLATQALEKSLQLFENYSLSWTNENVMNPEIFLEQGDIVNFEDKLENLFAIKLDNATNRRSIFITSGVDDSFIKNINFNSTPVEITNIVVAKFKNYKVSNQRVDYHPMINLLQYLLNRKISYELEDQDIDLFTKLVEQGRENFNALKARNTVCRIESPKGTGIGTGVLVGKNLLLTCNHIFSKTQVTQAWVRFNYNADNRQLNKDLFELDMTFVSYHNRPDYALVKIKDNPQQQKAISRNETLNSGQDIRIIHHPQGNPVIISDFGQITQVGEDYIDHNVKTDDGSSGAPIFNCQWELIAIHQGNPGIGRNGTLGSTGGIPIRAIWNQISPHLG